MTFDIITLFPDMFKGPFDESILRRAQDKLLIKINYHNLRKWAVDKRGSVDDRPYGGGVGMVLRVEPVFNSLKAVKKLKKSKIILMDPRGKKFNQEMAREYAGLDQLIIICGHYEGVDERVKEHLVDEAVSVGDYILTGGEIPAMIITDAVTRLLPGVLSKEDATKIESFSDGDCLEFSQYTRPEDFKGWKVPSVLLSGNHAKIIEWRGSHE